MPNSPRPGWASAPLPEPSTPPRGHSDALPGLARTVTTESQLDQHPARLRLSPLIGWRRRHSPHQAPPPRLARFVDPLGFRGKPLTFA